MNVYTVWYLIIAYHTGGQHTIPQGNLQQCEINAKQYQQSMHNTADVFCVPSVEHRYPPGYPR